MGEPEELVLPEYGKRSLSEVLPSMLSAIGVPGMANRLGVAPARSACLLLVDGLGAHQLADAASYAPFLSTMDADLGPLTVGFPSSTSISLASLGTGTPPGAHGMVGISFRIAPDTLLDSLRWTSHTDDARVDLTDRFPPEVVQPNPTVFELAAGAGVRLCQVVPREFENSPLTMAALRGAEFRGVQALGDLAAEVSTALSGPEPAFCYCYHSHLDSLGHRYGPGSLPWRLQLAAVDHLVEMIAERLPADTLFAVTADHGMIEAPESRRINADSDPLLQAGVRMIGGDPRARHVYAEPGAAADVLARWRERLGEQAWVLAGEEAIEQGWFGPQVSEVARTRIGDVVVAMRDNAIVVRPGAEPGISTVPGQHGSLTAAEQLVPFLAARG